jgi:hypothetical protein
MLAGWAGFPHFIVNVIIINVVNTSKLKCHTCVDEIYSVFNIEKYGKLVIIKEEKYI